MSQPRFATFLTIKAFLEEVPIGRTLLYDEIRRGRIRTVKIGSRTMIPSVELERLIESSVTNVADIGNHHA